jgi:hypothetical protein
MAALPANPATGLPPLAPVGVVVSEYYLWLTAAVFWGLYGYQYGGQGEGNTPPVDDAGAVANEASQL